MTKIFRTQINCPNCGTMMTAESAFSRWIRDNQELKSEDGYCVVDLDYIVHKYKVYGNRHFQCLMLVEIKTMGAECIGAQKDTLLLMDQLMKNRRVTPTKDAPWQSGGGISKARSYFLNQDVLVKAFGCHVLAFAGYGPDDSAWIKWDGKVINKVILTDLLAFNLDPTSLNEIDLRSHHQTHENKNLPLFSDDAAA